MNEIWWAVVFACGGVLAFACALIVFHRRAEPSAIPFVALMTGVAWWQWMGAGEMLAVGADAKMFWATLAYFGIATVPLFWFLFAAAYSGKTVFLTPRYFALLALPAFAKLLAVFTNSWHHLYWTEIIPGADPQASLIYEHGVLFWLLVVADYTFMLAGTVLLARALLRAPHLFKQQVLVLLIALCIPWTANALYIFGVGSLNHMDLTPLALTLTGATWVIALFGNRLFDLMPVAREVVVEKMSDGVIVLDAQNRIVDMNAAAVEMFELSQAEHIGATAAHSLPQLPAWIFETNAAQRKEIQFTNHTGEPRVLSAQISLLQEQHTRSGRILLLHDITAHKQTQATLEQMNHQLQTQLTEIQALQATLEEQATRDPLTGLYNRRYLYEMLGKELNYASRTLRPLSVVMLDIDHFKSFNDRYGHYAGDMMLKALGDWLRTKTRRGDFICRYGGEEFVIVMPNASLEVSSLRAQEWCAGFRELRLWHEDMLLHTTLSLGVASSPEHGTTPDDIIHSADLAMYAAKQDGRDCVRIADSPATLPERQIRLRQAA